MTVVFWSRSITLFSCGKIVSFVNALRETSNLKLGMSIAVRLAKPMESEAVEAFFNWPMCRIACELTEDEYMQHIDALMTQLNVFATGGSGWVVKTFKQLEIKTAACGNVTGGSYIETPSILKPFKRSILIVVNNRDISCFLYCFAATIFSFIGRPHSPKIHQKNIERLSFNPKSMPMPLSAFPTFEKRNHCSININWRTPSWCQCFTVRTEKDDTKLTCCAYWRTKTVNIGW